MDTLYFSADMIKTMRIAPTLNRDSLLAGESDYVVTVPHKGQNGPSERVAYGWSIPLTRKAAGQLARAVQSFYKPAGQHSKPRAIMMKTARKDGLI